jgi:hypothetical protein
MSKKVKDISRDIRDINYFIDHVKDIDFRISLIKELGYKIGVNVATKNCYEKDITIGKRKEARIQIMPKEKNSPLVACAIIE